ncbi:hypothetical protein FKP32DRAFT_1595734 [Trametes sanguinea]|nr:hypothetical protein FKP32DRAFT_1595734 [Trametes sanguinea]
MRSSVLVGGRQTTALQLNTSQVHHIRPPPALPVRSLRLHESANTNISLISLPRGVSPSAGASADPRSHQIVCTMFLAELECSAFPAAISTRTLSSDLAPVGYRTFVGCASVVRNIPMRWLPGHRRCREHLPDSPPAPPRPAADPSSSGIFIHLTNVIHVSGCPIDGKARLYLWRLREDDIEEIRLEFRGRATTRVTRNGIVQTEATSLVHTDIPLWVHDVQDDDPDLGYIEAWRPFNIQLPPHLPPTLCHSAPAASLEVRYTLTVVGIRPAIPHNERRIHIPIVVVPRDSSASVNVKTRLPGTGVLADPTPWKTERAEKRIRRGLWGQYATAQVQITLPDVSALPLYTRIPFFTDILTTSPPLTRAKADTFSSGKPVFPSVPTAFTALDFRLRRRLRVRADTLIENVSSDIAVFTRATAVISAVQGETPPGWWQPLHGVETKGPGEMGRWVQRSRFRSTFQLACAPSFTTDTIECQYFLELTVPFSGAGNDVQMSLPVRVTSGLDAPAARDKLDSPAPLEAHWDFPADLPLYVRV